MRITNYYRNVARELKRLESVSRSPIYSHFSETLNGLPVIRSFKRAQKFQAENERRVDDNLATFNVLKVVDRWLSVRLELLGNIIVLAAAALTVVASSKAGAAGISLNNALSVTSLLNWAVRNVVETESMMNSVERVLFITQNTPVERPEFVSGFNSSIFLPSDHWSAVTPPTNDSDLIQNGWPWQGGLIFSGVKLRYRADMEQVLKNLTLSIQPGERVGVVGRTGSGKSSIFRALLRLTEPDAGKIYLDGVDISAVGLDALRSGVSIIPQDPVLFSGTIRANLDPFGQISDADLWSALKKVNLLETVAALPDGLSFVVAEGGENFSIGQRQLICLARALVRRSKLLLLDEATSSVDYETDAFIQKTIKEEFKFCTVLTIAHRLSNILDSDKVLVMDAGEVAEYDSPSNLLKDPKSFLFRLFNAKMQSKTDYTEFQDESDRIESCNSNALGTVLRGDLQHESVREDGKLDEVGEPIDGGPRGVRIADNKMDFDLS
jgi:ABC-type multidrug transport system fused ATPase/permease subunit